MLNLRDQACQQMPVVPNIPELNEAAIGTWKARMVNEYGSARNPKAFIANSKCDLDPSDLDRLRPLPKTSVGTVSCVAPLSRRWAEKRSHPASCGPISEHPDVSDLEGAIRNLISISCMSETVAVSLIGAERLEMPEGPLRELLTTIYADECAHANFGWRLLGDLLERGGDVLKENLKPYVQLAFAHLEMHELAHPPIAAKPPKEGLQLGLCSVSMPAPFSMPIEQVIIPGLTAHGLDAQWAWDTRSRQSCIVTCRTLNHCDALWRPFRP